MRKLWTIVKSWVDAELRDVALCFSLAALFTPITLLGLYWLSTGALRHQHWAEMCTWAVAVANLGGWLIAAAAYANYKDRVARLQRIVHTRIVAHG